MKRVHSAPNWIGDRSIGAGLWVLDGIAGPMPETPDDEAIRAEGDRLRRTFPALYQHESDGRLTPRTVAHLVLCTLLLGLAASIALLLGAP